MKEERYVLIGAKPELVTLSSGEVISLHSKHEPVSLTKDSGFKRLRSQRRLKKIMVNIPAALPAPAPAPVPAPVPAREHTRAELMTDANGNVAAESVLVETILDLNLRPSLVEDLVEAGFETIEDLESASDEDILAIDGIGPKSLSEIREALSRLD